MALLAPATACISEGIGNVAIQDCNANSGEVDYENGSWVADNGLWYWHRKDHEGYHPHGGLSGVAWLKKKIWRTKFSGT